MRHYRPRWKLRRLTTIACNRESIAGDLQYTNLQTGYKFKGASKVHKFKPNELIHPDGEFIVGFCGTASDVCNIISFFVKPELFKKPPKVNGVSGIVLTEDRQLFLFEHYLEWLGVKEDYCAVGSGAAYAVGVLSQGGTPKEAVKVASKHDAFTGLGVRELKF